MGLVALLALVACMPAWSADLKVGLVEFQRLLEESPQAKAVKETLQSEFGPRQRDLLTLQQNFKSRQEKLQKDAPTMSDDQRQRAEKELRDMQRDIERKGQEFQDDLNARRNEELQRLQHTLVEEVRTYAKAQSFDMIVTDQSTVYWAPPLDITPAILATLQARAGSAAPATKPAGSSSSASKQGK
jgi:outer membrane protein